MKKIIAIEEAAQFGISVLVITQLPVPLTGWLIPAFFAPDLFAAGYLINNRWGALLYNFAHHKLTAILLIIAGIVLKQDFCTLTGLLFYGHSSFDRMLGYGLKYNDSFSHTHLGYIGKEKYRNRPGLS